MLRFGRLLRRDGRIERVCVGLQGAQGVRYILEGQQYRACDIALLIARSPASAAFCLLASVSTVEDRLNSVGGDRPEASIRREQFVHSVCAAAVVPVSVTCGRRLAIATPIRALAAWKIGPLPSVRPTLADQVGGQAER